MNDIEIRPDIRSQIMDMFNTGREVIQYLAVNGVVGQECLLQDMKQVCLSLKQAIETQYDFIKQQNKLPEIALNAPETLDTILVDLQQDNIEHAQMTFTCSFAPLFLFWERYANYFLVYTFDQESQRAYYNQEQLEQKQRRQRPVNWNKREYRYDLSIVVLFYGNRKMTEECLNTIQKYTKGHSYELITFDNGSDIATADWCEGLPHVKKIRYNHNVGSSLAGSLIFTMAGLYSEGKYLLYISNDVLVTPKYDEILFSCMESDPRIAMAAPLCNSASNLQAISVPYEKNDIQGMLKFAEQFNHYNPLKWRDRSRLFTILACIRFEVLEQFYLAFDPLFCYDMFADDDFSTNIRRSGYRQVLCGDVFVHHFGSATIGSSQYEAMGKGRKQFYQKYGVDGWKSIGLDLHQTIEKIPVKTRKKIDALVINPKFGDGALEFINHLMQNGCGQVNMDALTEDPRYLDDMEPLFQRCGLCSDNSFLNNKQYDYVMVCNRLETCDNLWNVLDIVGKCLKSNGLAILQYKNSVGLSHICDELTPYEDIQYDYYYDMNGNPFELCVSPHILNFVLNKKHLICTQQIDLIDDDSKVVADHLLNCLSVENNLHGIKKKLSTTEYFTIWSKQE